ncbi:hypothetical protein B0H13DRAFT_2363492 [Mycena leptocephala]|nr:hypothetical protein B0H13DRAFT_2363492 [Mycena leptocephala]
MPSPTYYSQFKPNSNLSLYHSMHGDLTHISQSNSELLCLNSRSHLPRASHLWTIALLVLLSMIYFHIHVLPAAHRTAADVVSQFTTNDLREFFMLGVAIQVLPDYIQLRGTDVPTFTIPATDCPPKPTIPTEAKPAHLVDLRPQWLIGPRMGRWMGKGRHTGLPTHLPIRIWQTYRTHHCILILTATLNPYCRCQNYRRARQDLELDFGIKHRNAETMTDASSRTQAKPMLHLSEDCTYDCTMRYIP